MAHELVINAAGKASMAYVGATPWHGLGQNLPVGQTIEQWTVAAGLNYSVMRAMVQYQNGSLRDFPGREVLYRSDTSAPLGVVSDGYKIVQPSETLEFFRDLCEEQGFALETAGAIKGGAVYWALAKTGHTAEAAPGDVSKGYVLLSTSADGSRATDARFTSIRVVCNNTLSLALNRGDKSAVKTRHSTQFCAKATKQALGLVDFDAAWRNYADSMQALVQQRVTTGEATEFFSELLRPAGMRAAPRQALGADSLAGLLAAPVGGKVDFAPTDKSRAIRGLEDLEQSYLCAPGAAPGSAYGLLQGVTHYIDHVRSTSTDKRLASAWFGQGDNMKQEAYARLVDRYSITA
jgi:phage/plasmid-like protein (TIGR03299 family)